MGYFGFNKILTVSKLSVSNVFNRSYEQCSGLGPDHDFFSLLKQLDFAKRVTAIFHFESVRTWGFRLFRKT